MRRVLFEIVYVMIYWLTGLTYYNSSTVGMLTILWIFMTLLPLILVYWSIRLFPGIIVGPITTITVFKNAILSSFLISRASCLPYVKQC